MVLSVSIHSLPPSHILLLAIHFASSSDLNSLRGLRALHPAILTPAVFLRVLIFLPESTPPSAYIPLLKAILGTPESFSQPHAEKPTAIDIAPVSALSEKQARRKLDKLLAHVLTFSGTQEELVSEWLIVRSQNIDTETGILSIVETLLAPFIDIQRIDRYYHGTIEVLSRLIYEHNRNEFESGDRTGNGWNAEASAAQPVKGLCQFEALNAQTAVRYLLQKTTKETAVRDIVTLVTPYLRYRDQDSKVNGWYVVWEWLCSQDLRTVLEVFIPWGGPQDCGDGFMEGYAKTGMASCYACREATSEVYDIMAKIQERIVDILGIQFDVNVASQKGIDKSRYAENVRLRSTTHDLLQPSNALTSPTPESLNLLSLLISSASILSIPLYAAAQVRISGDKEEHKTLLIRYVRSANWTIRNEREWKNIVEATRWLRNQSGIIEQLSEAECEEVLLRGLLTSCKFKLVQDLYLRNDVRILGIEKLEEAVLDAFQEFYDNASNGNKTRGGMKNADSA